MKLMKKFVALLLVAAMLSSFVLVASATPAEDENVVLTAYRDDGTPIGANDTIMVGDEVKVQITTTEDVWCCVMNLYVTYDAEYLQFSEANSRMGDICKTFNNYDLNGFTETLENEKIPVGQTAVLVITGSITNRTVPANTMWAEFSFTALKETTATELVAIVNEAYYLSGENGFGDILDVEGLVPGNLTLAVAPAPVAVESVTLNKDKLTLAYGASEQLTATVLPDNADDKTVTWTSENDAVATVTDGLVVGVSEGTTRITATAGSATASCEVSVAAEGVIPVTGITINGANPRTVAITTNTTLVAAVTPSDATDASKIEWTSSNEEVATVASGKNPKQGKLTLKAVGQTVITATAGGYSASVTVNVTNPITAVNISPASASVAVGERLRLIADVLPADTTDDTTVTWTSSNTSVATVDNNGVLTALSAGTTNIVAKAGTKSKICKVTVIQLEEGTYTVSMPDDQTVSAGDTVSLPVSVGSSDESVTSFNAFDMKFTYDPDALELMTTQLTGCEVVAENGSVRVISYGEEKMLGNAFALQFRAKSKQGATTVSVTSALVGISDEALAENAKKATFTKASTTLNVRVQYGVTLPEEMSSDQGTLIDAGTDYTFKITNKDAYCDYAVSATMGETEIVVKDNGDGSYTVENVTGALVITMTKTGKSFGVTVTGDDVQGADTATYGTDYSFTVTKQADYQHDIKVTVGGSEYTGTTGPDENGTYTIPGSDIKGEIIIQVTKTEIVNPDAVQVFVEGSGKAAVTAAAKAIKGQDFTFTVKWENGYVYTVGVNINGSDYKNVTPVISEDGMTRTYTVPGAAIDGPIVLTVDKDKAFSVTWNNQKPDDIKITELTTDKKIGTTYSFAIKNTFKVYKLIVSVKENGVEKTVSVDVTDSGTTRNNYTYTVENVQGDLEITLDYVVNTDIIAVEVTPFVELDDKTVFLIATRTKEGYDRSLKLDTYNGYGMYQITGTLYADRIKGSAQASTYMTCLWLVTVDAGQSFTAEDAMQHLTYTNFLNISKPADTVYATADVNQSKLIDVNDAQLVYDIYNGVYPTYCMTNKLSGNFVEEQTGASMTKFLLADVNRDMKVDLTDAAAVINQIK